MRIRNGCRTQTAMRPQTPKHAQSWTFIKNLWVKLNRVKSSYYINKALNRNVTLAVDWTLPLTTSRGHSVIPENSLFNWQPVKHFLFSVQMAAKFSSTLRSLAVLYDHRVLLYFTSRELYSCCMSLFIYFKFSVSFDDFLFPDSECKWWYHLGLVYMNNSSKNVSFENTSMSTWAQWSYITNWRIMLRAVKGALYNSKSSENSPLAFLATTVSKWTCDTSC